MTIKVGAAHADCGAGCRPAHSGISTGAAEAERGREALPVRMVSSTVLRGVAALRGHLAASVRLGPESFTPAAPDAEIATIARAADDLGRERS